MKHIMSNKKKKSGNSYTTFQQYMNRFTEFFDSDEILEAQVFFSYMILDGLDPEDAFGMAVDRRFI